GLLARAGRDARGREATAHVRLLAGVAQPGECEAEAGRSVVLQVTADAGGSAHRDDGDAVGREVASLDLGEGGEGGRVAGAFDEHDRANASGRDRERPSGCGVSVHSVTDVT